MSDETPRAQPRFLTDLDILLRDMRGNLIEESAQAHDVTPNGFRLQTKAALQEDSEVNFVLRLDELEQVEGRAKVVWTQQDQWGGFVSGAKITSISWNDRRRLRRQAHRIGFDFAALARKAVLAVYWAVIVAGVRNVLLYQPHVRNALWSILPVIGAAIVLGLGLTLLLRR